MTTLTLRARAVNQKAISLALPVIHWKMVYVAGMLSVAVMLVLYVYLINQLTGGTYLIKNYNKQMDALLTESRTLQTNFAESGFLGSIEQKVGQLSFQKTTDIKYVHILDWRQPTIGMVK